ncbi:hypothetical protein [Helicobacter apodemus]|nr:hypothetical protein [Helicobacter apodemus]
MRQNLRYLFHMLIIAQIIFFNGCGFKDDPFRDTNTSVKEDY